MKPYLLAITICLLINIAAVAATQTPTALACLGLTVACWFFVLGLTITAPRR